MFQFEYEIERFICKYKSHCKLQFYNELMKIDFLFLYAI